MPSPGSGFGGRTIIVVPETFTHGFAQPRQRLFQRGFDGGKLEDCDTVAAGPQL
jgi:predicted metalloprotease